MTLALNISRPLFFISLSLLLKCHHFTAQAFSFHCHNAFEKKANQNEHNFSPLHPFQTSVSKYPDLKLLSKKSLVFKKKTRSHSVLLASSVSQSQSNHIPQIFLTTVLTKLKKGFANLGKPKPALKFVATAIALFLTAISLRDTIEARRRQAIDETSEWGKYADYPSVRGRALAALMLKMIPYILLAKILNSFSTMKFQSSTWFRRKTHQVHKQSGEILVKGLLRLGPLYIKMGQILSCRKELLPDEWKTSLEILQDNVPSKSGKEALELAYQAYDGGKEHFDSLFKDFDDVPLAAASLGQVHRATLISNNATVAIKLQRARLRDIYDKDLALMLKLSKMVDRFVGGQVGGVNQSWEEIFTDAKEILYREIDYRDEATNSKRFASDFGLGLGGKAIPCTSKSLGGKLLPSAAEWMRTPYVYEKISSERALVMEYVPSIKISDDAGIDVQDKEYLAECLARAYLRQFCVNQFFSTDPHPGNLGIEINKEKGKSHPRLVFYDFGQACSLQDNQAKGILDVIEGIVDMNVDNCVNAFDRMGVLADGADLEKIKRKVANNFETGKLKVKKRKKTKNGSSSSLSNSKTVTDRIEIGDNTTLGVRSSLTNSTSSTKINNEGKINDMEVMSYFTLPAEYAFVARAISQMDGVGKGLDTDFDFISAAAPYLVEIKGGEKYLADEVTKNVQKFFKF